MHEMQMTTRDAQVTWLRCPSRVTWALMQSSMSHGSHQNEILCEVVAGLGRLHGVVMCSEGCVRGVGGVGCAGIRCVWEVREVREAREVQKVMGNEGVWEVLGDA